MKKMFFALAALLLAFTACTSENEAMDTPNKKEVKVTVNMDKPGFVEDSRAPRRGWEEGDEVVVYFGSPLFCLKLTYNESTWTNEAWVDEEWDGGTFTQGDSDILNEIFADFFYEDEDEISSRVCAVYFSSGVKEITFGPITARAAAGPGIEVLNIETKASAELKGECIMTCEDGTATIKRTDEGYELILNITMIPRVAQFTIRDLDFNNFDDKVLSVYGTLTAYAGAIIRNDGSIKPNPIEPDEDILVYDCWPHFNEDGVSIYASPWTEATDVIPPVCFVFGYLDGSDEGLGYRREYVDKTDLKNGDAVIMNGPFTAGADSWDEWNPYNN